MTIRTLFSATRLTRHAHHLSPAQTPPSGANVKAHYVGKLADGSDFDSSRKRGRPFTFVRCCRCQPLVFPSAALALTSLPTRCAAQDIGQGRVIKGWDVGIATMQKGEKAVFTIAPDYGYGEAGAGGVIPGGATLVFEVELLEWM